MSHSNPGYKQVPTAAEFINESHYDTSLICDLTRYRTPNRVYHEFVVIHTVDAGDHDQWFRFDRVPTASGPSKRSAVTSSKDVAVKDQVSVG